MISEHFKQDEIPFEKLEKFGLTKEMIEDLPQVITLRLLAARATPPLPIMTDNQDGKKTQSLARISLVRLDDGTVDVVLAPRWIACDLDKFSDGQQRNLLAGKVIMTDIEGRGVCYGQYDESIQQVMTVPIGVIRQNINIIQRSRPYMSNAQAEIIAKGKVLELHSPDGQLASIGIDLEEVIGLRFANGEAILWEQEKSAERLPKYNFGIFGCWQADENNCLSYIVEDDYTPEMWDEQRRAGQQNAANENMRHMNR